MSSNRHHFNSAKLCAKIKDLMLFLFLLLPVILVVPATNTHAQYPIAFPNSSGTSSPTLQPKFVNPNLYSFQLSNPSTNPYPTHTPVPTTSVDTSPSFNRNEIQSPSGFDLWSSILVLLSFSVCIAIRVCILKAFKTPPQGRARGKAKKALMERLNRQQRRDWRWEHIFGPPPPPRRLLATLAEFAGLVLVIFVSAVFAIWWLTLLWKCLPIVWKVVWPLLKHAGQFLEDRMQRLAASSFLANVMRAGRFLAGHLQWLASSFLANSCSRALSNLRLASFFLAKSRSQALLYLILWARYATLVGAVDGEGDEYNNNDTFTTHGGRMLRVH